MRSPAGGRHWSHDGSDGGGYLVYMAGHEGRGHWAKAATYLLQDDGEDTYQANQSLGLPDDSRDFSDAAAVLRWRPQSGLPAHDQ